MNGRLTFAFAIALLVALAAFGAASASGSTGNVSLRNSSLIVHTAKDASPGSQTSVNWAGFIASGPGSASVTQSKVSFTRVAGSWIEPTATCVSGSRTGSAFWVGLGGANDSSQALEQTGTSVDCNLDGTPHYYAWYELVPAPSRPITMAVNPGDTISASVKYLNKKITLTIKNVTQGTHFTKTVKFAKADRSSAEWIAEAPSECAAICSPISLTNFGTVSFTGSSATARGHTGTISDGHWGTTQVTLQTDPQDPFGPKEPSGNATPSDLSPDGTAFSVAWQAPPPPSQP